MAWFSFQVSKSWLEVIKTCENYWKAQCEDYGLLGESLTRERCTHDSYYDVAMSLLKQDHRLKNKLVIGKTELKSDLSSTCGSERHVPVQPFHNGFILQYPVQVPSARLSLFRVNGNSVDKCGQIDDIFPGGFLEILWSTSTQDSVLLYANNNLWAEFLFSIGASEDPLATPTTTIWEHPGGIPMRSVYNSYSMCEKCRLVVSVSTKSGKKGLLEFSFLEFGKNPDVIQQSSMLVGMEEDWCYFNAIKKTCIFPVNSCPSKGSTCHGHKQLIQFGSVVVQFDIKVCASDGQKYLVSNSKTYCPHDESQLPACELGEFSVSSDKKLLSLVGVAGTLESHTWHLESGEYTQVDLRHSDCHSVFMGRYLAVGHLYQLLAIWHGNLAEVCVHLKGCGKLVRLASFSTSSSILRSCTCGKNAGEFLLELPSALHGFQLHFSQNNDQWLSSLCQSALGSIFYLVVSEGVLVMLKFCVQ